MYTIRFSEKALKQIKKLDRNTQERIIASLDRIKIRPESFVTKLVGDVAYRFRVGNYRIIMDINNNELQILVIKIGHRRNIYK